MTHFAPIAVLFSFASPASVPVQQVPQPLGLYVARDHRLDLPAVREMLSLHPPASGRLQVSTSSHRLHRGVVGGLIGIVAGLATCTLISNAFFNEGTGVSACTTKGNLMFAGGGFALGFAVGWLTGGNHE